MKWRRNNRSRRLSVVWLQIILLISQIQIFGIGLVALYLGYFVELLTYRPGATFEFFHLLLTTPSTLMIYYGMLIAFSGLTGLFGNLCGSGWMIRWGALSAILIILLDFSIGVQAFTRTNSLLISTAEIANSMNDYGLKGARPIGIWQLTPKDYWDGLQVKGRCCGLKSYDDWLGTRIGKNDDLPSSCCKDMTPNCGEGILTDSWNEIGRNASKSYLNLINQQGCWEYQEIIMKYYKEYKISGLVAGSILLFSIWLALVLSVAVLLNRRPHHRGLYGLRDLIRCGKSGRVGSSFRGWQDDLIPYKKSATMFQAKNRENYFDRTGGIPEHPADFHPKDAAVQVKKWASKNPGDENRQSTPPANATRKWPLNLSEEELQKNFLIHTPQYIPFEDFYADHLAHDTKKVRRH